MIRTRRLENCRSFRACELRDLARVSLLVGRNICGRTSVLEAVYLLVSQGDPCVLIQAASRSPMLEGRYVIDLEAGARVSSGLALADGGQNVVNTFPERMDLFADISSGCPTASSRPGG